MSNPRIIFIHDLVEENGKTIKENNLARRHNIPLGTLVEVKYDSWHGNGACEKVHARLWVVHHGRDCDGTPLYGISRWNDPTFAYQVNHVQHGFAEESLSVVQITEDIKDGYGTLKWDDEPESK